MSRLAPHSRAKAARLTLALNAFQTRTTTSQSEQHITGQYHHHDHQQFKLRAFVWQRSHTEPMNQFGVNDVEFIFAAIHSFSTAWLPRSLTSTTGKRLDAHLNEQLVSICHAN